MVLVRVANLITARLRADLLYRLWVVMPTSLCWQVICRLSTVRLLCSVVRTCLWVLRTLLCVSIEIVLGRSTKKLLRSLERLSRSSNSVVRVGLRSIVW